MFQPCWGQLCFQGNLLLGSVKRTQALAVFWSLLRYMGMEASGRHCHGLWALGFLLVSLLMMNLFLTSCIAKQHSLRDQHPRTIVRFKLPAVSAVRSSPVYGRPSLVAFTLCIIDIICTAGHTEHLKPRWHMRLSCVELLLENLITQSTLEVCSWQLGNCSFTELRPNSAPTTTSAMPLAGRPSRAKLRSLNNERQS
jgi:hypothetical protein